MLTSHISYETLLKQQMSLSAKSKDDKGYGEEHCTNNVEETYAFEKFNKSAADNWTA